MTAPAPLELDYGDAFVVAQSFVTARCYLQAGPMGTEGVYTTLADTIALRDWLTAHIEYVTRAPVAAPVAAPVEPTTPPALPWYAPGPLPVGVKVGQAAPPVSSKPPPYRWELYRWEEFSIKGRRHLLLCDGPSNDAVDVIYQDDDGKWRLQGAPLNVNPPRHPDRLKSLAVARFMASRSATSPKPAPPAPPAMDLAGDAALAAAVDAPPDLGAPEPPFRWEGRKLIDTATGAVVDTLNGCGRGGWWCDGDPVGLDFLGYGRADRAQYVAERRFMASRAKVGQ